MGRSILLLFLLTLLSIHIPSISSRDLDPRTDPGGIDWEAFVRASDLSAEERDWNLPDLGALVDYTSPAAQAQFQERLATLEQRPHETFFRGSITVKTIMFDTLDKAQLQIFLHKDSEEECDFVIVVGTHGAWVLKVQRDYGDGVSKDSKTLSAFVNSKAFATYIRSVLTGHGGLLGNALLGNNRDDVLFSFLGKMREKGGKLTHILKVMKSQEDSNIGPILDSVLFEIRIYANRNNIPNFVDSIERYAIEWKEKEAPFDIPSNRVLILEIRYSISEPEPGSWLVHASYATQLLLFVSTGADSCQQDLPGSIRDVVWNTARKLECVGTNPDTTTVSWDTVTWDKTTIGLIEGFENSLGKSKKINTSGIVILVLTTKGYWARVYTASALSDKRAVKPIRMDAEAARAVYLRHYDYVNFAVLCLSTLLPLCHSYVIGRLLQMLS